MDTKTLSIEMNKARKFFMVHAGWSYDPKIETPEEGRKRSAQKLAEAERWAKDEGISFVWEDDWEIDHLKEYDCYDEEPTTCETCSAYDADGTCVAALGCIDDATPEYRRVIEAELAWEAKPQ